MMNKVSYDSPVGKLLLAEQDGGLTGLWIEGQKYCPDLLISGMADCETPVLVRAERWLDRYFSGEKPEIQELRLTPAGSAFRQAVWKILCEIPYGTCLNYGEIAARMAALTGRKRMSAQAVGGAVAHNPVSIIIPCHRVVGRDGNLTGYAGGIERKIQLLTHEGLDMTKFYVPRAGLHRRNK